MTRHASAAWRPMLANYIGNYRSSFLPSGSEVITGDTYRAKVGTLAQKHRMSFGGHQASVSESTPLPCHDAKINEYNAHSSPPQVVENMADLCLYSEDSPAPLQLLALLEKQWLINGLFWEEKKRERERETACAISLSPSYNVIGGKTNIYGRSIAFLM